MSGDVIDKLSILNSWYYMFLDIRNKCDNEEVDRVVENIKAKVLEIANEIRKNG